MNCPECGKEQYCDNNTRENTETMWTRAQSIKTLYYLIDIGREDWIIVTAQAILEKNERDPLPVKKLINVAQWLLKQHHLAKKQPKPRGK